MNKEHFIWDTLLQNHKMPKQKRVVQYMLYKLYSLFERLLIHYMGFFFFGLWIFVDIVQFYTASQKQ